MLHTPNGLCPSVVRMDNDSFDKTLTDTIREIRETAGISLNALAAMTAIPYVTLYRKLEQGAGSLLAKDVNNIAKALNVKADVLWPKVAA
jgi:transcriptional regulator with XRE-family HTH domain